MQPPDPATIPAGQGNSAGRVLAPRLTAGQRQALLAIAARAGQLHAVVGESLERLGLAVLLGRNYRSAGAWALTPEGALAAASLTKKAA